MPEIKHKEGRGTLQWSDLVCGELGKRQPMVP